VEGLVRDTARFLGRMRDFREFDGSNNSLLHPSSGETGARLLRTAPAEYADGLSEPAGRDRPGGARDQQHRVRPRTGRRRGGPTQRSLHVGLDLRLGQFVDHDLDLTTTGSTPFDIPVPKGDLFFDPNSTGTQVIPLDRSNFDEGTGTKRNLHLLGDGPLRRRQAFFE
jgi:peroxidase